MYKPAISSFLISKVILTNKVSLQHRTRTGITPVELKLWRSNSRWLLFRALDIGIFDFFVIWFNFSCLEGEAADISEALNITLTTSLKLQKHRNLWPFSMVWQALPLKIPEWCTLLQWYNKYNERREFTYIAIANVISLSHAGANATRTYFSHHIANVRVNLSAIGNVHKLICWSLI